MLDQGFGNWILMLSALLSGGVSHLELLDCHCLAQDVRTEFVTRDDYQIVPEAVSVGVE